MQPQLAPPKTPTPSHAQRALWVVVMALAMPPAAVSQNETGQTFGQNGSPASSTGAAYLNDIGHISSFGPYGDGSHDDTPYFQNALNACGANFGTLEITATKCTVSCPNLAVGYNIMGQAGSTTALAWGPAASCRVIIRKGAIVAGNLPPPDSNHVIYDENALAINPFPSPASNQPGFVATSDNSGNSATLAPSGVAAGTAPFGITPLIFGAHGPNATVGAYNALGGALALGPGNNTGTAAGGGIYFQVSPPAGSSNNNYNGRVTAWAIRSSGNLAAIRSGQSVGIATGPIDSLFLCPQADTCTFGAGYYNITGTTGIAGNAYTQQLPNNSGTFEVAPFANAGDIGYYNGTTFPVLTGNTSGTVLLTENASGAPSWTPMAQAATSGTILWSFCNGTVGTANGTTYYLSGFQNSSDFWRNEANFL